MGGRLSLCGGSRAKYGVHPKPTMQRDDAVLRTSEKYLKIANLIGFDSAYILVVVTRSRRRCALPIQAGLPERCISAWTDTRSACLNPRA